MLTDPILQNLMRVALGEEGIFRIPGSATEIKELKQRYDKGTVSQPHTNTRLSTALARYPAH